MKLYYSLETIDAIIISQSPATAETHKSLDYIPGSTILGAIAGKCYSYLEEENRNWNMFHSGTIKFSNAYIAHADTQSASICYPTPLSWHAPKGEDLYSKEGLNPEIQNHAHTDFKMPDDIQYKQCRTGYINPSKKQSTCRRGSSTKTAINKDTETVQESQLFNYNYIKAGQKFIGSISIDDKIISSFLECQKSKSSLEEEIQKLKENPAEYQKQMQDHCDVKNFIELYDLITQVTRLGRSRNTEFGRVKVALLKDPEEIQTEVKNTKENDLITIWLTSDCQLLDDYGFPVLAPTAKQVGLNEDAELILSQSFINTHSTILYNRKRQGLDSEQVLINKGSVLVYKAKKDIKAEVLDKLQQKGIGINQQQGYGNIIINPPWAEKLSPVETALFNPISFTLNTNDQTKKTSNASFEPTDLINWVKAQAQLNQQKNKRDKEVNKHLKTILNFYKNGRSYNGISDKHNAGPSKNQWGLLYSLSRNSNTPITDDNEAFNTIVTSKSTDENDWNLDWDDGGRVSFENKFKKLFFSIKDSLTQRQLLEKLNNYRLETTQDIVKLKKFLEKNTEKSKLSSQQEKNA